MNEPINRFKVTVFFRIKLKSICALLFLTSVTVSLSVHSQSSERIALVIGNNDYYRVPLLNPVNDANAIGKKFQEMDYDYVRIENNTSRLQLEAALDEFSVRAENAEIAVIYYAGHGIQVDGENYIIPVDITLQKRRDVMRLISVDELLIEVSQAAKLGLIILDACRDNPFVDSLGETLGRSGALPRGLGRGGKLVGNTLVAYATEANAIADDGSGQHSPYTAALVRHIDTPSLEVRRMFGMVRDDVLKETQSLQRPFVYGSLGGEEIFLNNSSSQNNSNVDISEELDQREDTSKSSSKFYVNVEPMDARVRIMNIEPRYFPGIELERGGSYRVIVDRAGFQHYDKWIIVRKEKETLDVALALKAESQRSGIREIESESETVSCFDAVQNRIAWDYTGNRAWMPDNVELLCGGAESLEPARCFSTVMHEGVDWGGGTKWQWQNALNLCARTQNAQLTVQCFEEKIRSKIQWEQAIVHCTNTQNN